MTAAPATTQDDLFTRFVRETFAPVSRCAASWCGDKTLAEDLVQESYLKVFRTHNLAEELNIGYVLQALKWAILDNLRKETREQARLGKIDRAEADNLAADPDEWVSGRAELLALAKMYLDPEHENRFQRQRQWEVLTLTELGGYSAAEVGNILGLSPRTVRNYLTIIKAKFRELCSEE